MEWLVTFAASTESSKTFTLCRVSLASKSTALSAVGASEGALVASTSSLAPLQSGLRVVWIDHLDHRIGLRKQLTVLHRDASLKLSNVGSPVKLERRTGGLPRLEALIHRISEQSLDLMSSEGPSLPNESTKAELAVHVNKRKKSDIA